MTAGQKPTQTKFQPTEKQKTSEGNLCIAYLFLLCVVDLFVPCYELKRWG